jgi:hypothetical protein
LTACTLNANRAGDGGRGGRAGCFSCAGGHGGNGGSGGGIYNDYGATLILTACTISDNAGGKGGLGGINNEGFPSGLPGFQGSGSGLLAWNAVLQNVTVADNRIPANFPVLFVAGIHSSGNGTIILNNVLAAGNSSTTNSASDVKGNFVSQGNNFIETADGSTGLTNGVNGDQVGTLAAPLDAKLGPLQYNGGSTMTKALLAGSPAIDQGGTNGLAVDQRGRLRPVDDPAIANAGNGNGSDIGAFELQSQPITLAVPLKNGSNIVISFLSEIGQLYRIERNDRLDGSLWTTVTDNVAGTGAILQVNEPSSSAQRFYRVVTR